ncbi:MAG: hypothetical protein JNM93_05930 [Bacteriovoracaceae bacterium]|nr:hypothetical protein [Bacteriovoracaceae bacterium]
MSREHRKLILKTFEDSVKKYNQYREERQEFVDYLDKLTLPEENRQYIDTYIKRNPQFMFPRVEMNEEKIIMVHMGNKFSISPEDYLNDTFYFNNKKVKFDLNNPLREEFKKLNIKKKKGIPLFVLFTLVPNAYAQVDEAKTSLIHSGVGFYSLLFTIEKTQQSYLDLYIEKINFEVQQNIEQCEANRTNNDFVQQQATADVSFLGQDNFMKALKSALDHEDDYYLKVSVENCADDVKELFSVNEESARTVFLCQNLQQLDKCLLSYKEDIRFDDGRNPASVKEQDFLGEKEEGVEVNEE